MDRTTRVSWQEVQFTIWLVGCQLRICLRWGVIEPHFLLSMLCLGFGFPLLEEEGDSFELVKRSCKIVNDDSQLF